MLLSLVSLGVVMMAIIFMKTNISEAFAALATVVSLSAILYVLYVVLALF
jgi:hypothetical protein